MFELELFILMLLLILILKSWLRAASFELFYGGFEFNSKNYADKFLIIVYSNLEISLANEI
jgi:hypothetical protein